jgi:hypothetical protein
MQVEAIYSRGRIELIQPSSLKHDHVHVTVNVPDEEMDWQIPQDNLLAETISRAQAMLQQYEAILSAPSPADADLPQLGAEYDERLEAIDLRAQIRREEGRPV